MKKNDKIPPDGVLVIKTARSLRSINKAAKNGLWPLVKKLEPSKNLMREYFVMQDRDTGAVRVHYHVFESTFFGNTEKIIDFSTFYPYSFSSPFGAYLIPKELKKGTRVWLEDVIEDFVAGYDDDNNPYRVESALAEWAGDDFSIQFIPPPERQDWIG